MYDEKKSKALTRGATKHAVAPTELSASTSSSSAPKPQQKQPGAAAPEGAEEKTLDEESRPGGAHGAVGPHMPAPDPPIAAVKKRNQAYFMHPRSFRFGPHTMSFKPPNSWQATCARVCAHQSPGQPRTRCTRTLSFKGQDAGRRGSNPTCSQSVDLCLRGVSFLSWACASPFFSAAPCKGEGQDAPGSAESGN